MKGLAINFAGNAGATLLTSGKVSGFACTAQNGLVNIACNKGEDVIDADRGTNLYKDALAGRVPTFSDAYHIANFAALDTKFFLKKHTPEGEEIVEKVILDPITFDGNRLALKASFTSTAGTTIGINTSL